MEMECIRCGPCLLNSRGLNKLEAFPYPKIRPFPAGYNLSEDEAGQLDNEEGSKEPDTP